MIVNNVGGGGASTASDGIMVVEALNGATTSAGAFVLNGRVAAGAYEYFLFKGGVSADTDENWYLRSTLVNDSEPAATTEEEPAAEAPETAPPPPRWKNPQQNCRSIRMTPIWKIRLRQSLRIQRAGISTGSSCGRSAQSAGQFNRIARATALAGRRRCAAFGGATPVEDDVVTLHREEVPVYSAVPPVAHHLALSTLGTFHERRGEQDLLKSGGYLPASWARVFGQDVDMRWKGTVAPGLDGQLYGIQAGQDLYGRETESGHSDRFGLFSATPV